MVLGGFEAEGEAVGARGDAIHAQQAAARRDAQQLRIGRRRIDYLDECVRTRRVDALRFERGVDRTAEIELRRLLYAARRHA